MTGRDYAALIDHTLLRPEATAQDVDLLCDEAIVLHVCAVCVSPTMVRWAAEWLHGSRVKVATVIGFPSGAHRSEVKAGEAARACGDGADETDMVIDLGLARSGQWAEVAAEIAAVRAVLTGGQILKVILETAALSPEETAAACHVAESEGADFVRTSTGFHPAGGASVEAIRIMAACVGGRLGIQASGGIRDGETARAMVDAGATRLGLSASVAVLKELAAAAQTAPPDGEVDPAS